MNNEAIGAKVVRRLKNDAHLTTISVVDKAVDGLFISSAARGGGGVVAASVWGH